MGKLQPRTRTVLAWGLWLATFGCCAAGLVVALVVTRPLTLGVLVVGASDRPWGHPAGAAVA